MYSRIDRFNELLRTEIARIIIREIQKDRKTLVTITKVETSPDLLEAKVFVSVLPDNKGKDIIQQLNKKIYFIQQKLDKLINSRRVPKIIFRLDQELKKEARLEELFERIEKSKKAR